MGELKLLCQELDDLTLDYFSLLDQVHDKNAKMEACMRDGYILMAKARYSMGTKAVSALQYHLEDMESNISFHVTDQNYLPDNSIPELQMMNPNSDAIANAEDNAEKQTVRKRKVPKDEGDHDWEEVTNGVEDLNIGEKKNIQNGNGSPVVTNDDDISTAKRNDPLKWFGVLVPQALRQAQGKFKMAACLSCELANLKIKLDAVQGRLKESMRQKHQIIGGDDDYAYVSLGGSLLESSMSSSTTSTESGPTSGPTDT